MKTEQISIVLVEPQGPLNIGSVCRSMMNFGFSKLVLVNPQCDHLSGDALRMAVKTKRLLEEAVVVDTLADALKDVHCAFGPPVVSASTGTCSSPPRRPPKSSTRWGRT